MAKYRMTVYNPPAPDLPYLAVLMKPDGTAIATCYDTYEEAAEHVEEKAPGAAEIILRSKDA